MKRCYDLDPRDVKFLDRMRKERRMTRTLTIGEGLRLLRMAFDRDAGQICFKDATGSVCPIFGPWMDESSVA